jgi:hypothetical protein
MARLSITVTAAADWQPTDQVLLYIGTEDAADLANSTPAGGTNVQALTVGEVDEDDTITLEHTYIATDKCATLPVGVKLKDAAGNISAVTETTYQLADYPAGVGRPGVSSAASGQATLTWVASADLA